MYYYSFFFFFASYYFLYFVELVEGFYGGEVVDVETYDLVSYLTKDGVVQLEEAELHSLAALGYGCRRLACTAHSGIVGFEFLEYDVGTTDDALGHTRYLSHMNTEGVLRTAPHQFAKEDDLAIHLFHTDVVVLDATEVLLHLIEFVIMSGKESACLCPWALMQIFHYCPCYGYAVVGGSASSEFVE